MLFSLYWTVVKFLQGWEREREREREVNYGVKFKPITHAGKKNVSLELRDIVKSNNYD